MIRLIRALSARWRAGPALSALDERADLIAWLDQRIDNCRVMERRIPAFAPEAADRRRQLEVMRCEIAAGMHEGAAAMRAALKQGEI